MSDELSGDRAIERLREDFPAIYNAVYAMIAKVVAQGLAEADDRGDELADAPKLLAEVVKLRADLAEAVAALKVAVNEADAWHDDAQGGPIPDDHMNGARFGEVRAVLAKHGGA